jgi:hypothetical protein
MASKLPLPKHESLPATPANAERARCIPVLCAAGVSRAAVRYVRDKRFIPREVA